MTNLRPMFDEKLVKRFAYDVDVTKYLDEQPRGNLNRLVIHPIEVGNSLEFTNTFDSSESFSIPVEDVTEINTPQQTDGSPEKKDLLLEIEFKDNQGNRRSIAFNVRDKHIEELLIKTLKPMEQKYWDAIDLDYNFNGMRKTTQFYYKVPFLSEGEELLWINTKTQGIVNKHLAWLEALTNFRAIYYDFEKHDSGRIPLGLVDQVIVKNEGRTSTTARFGTFTTSEMNSIDENSGTIGDVLFMRDGRPIVTFVQVTSPQEVASLAETVMKQVFASLKIEKKVLLPMVGKSRTTGDPVCFYCGYTNSAGLEFCNKCGFALR